MNDKPQKQKKQKIMADLFLKTINQNVNALQTAVLAACRAFLRVIQSGCAPGHRHSPARPAFGRYRFVKAEDLRKAAPSWHSDPAAGC